MSECEAQEPVSQLERVTAIVEEELDLMGLTPEWRAVVKVVADDVLDKDGDDPAEADINWPIYYRTATIRFKESWLEGEPDDHVIRVTVRHELIHMLLAPLRDVIQKYVGWTDTQVGKHFIDAQESVADRLANVMFALQS